MTCGTSAKIMISSMRENTNGMNDRRSPMGTWFIAVERCENFERADSEFILAKTSSLSLLMAPLQTTYGGLAGRFSNYF